MFSLTSNFFFRFLKIDLPLDYPPPYEPTSAPFQLQQCHPPGDVNRNNDNRSSIDGQGEDMALLVVGTSEPTTPVDKQGKAWEANLAATVCGQPHKQASAQGLNNNSNNKA